MFEVGDKVVCLNAVPGPGTLDGHFNFPGGYLEQGKVYVVSGVRISNFKKNLNAFCLVICGIPVLVRQGDRVFATGEDVGFQASRFRKLLDIKAENQEKRNREKEIYDNRKP